MTIARRAQGVWRPMLGALLLAAAYLLWQTGVLPRLPVEVAGSPPAMPVSTSTWLSLRDGAVLRESLTGEMIERIDTSVFGHAYAQTATQIGWDGQQGLLWYSDSHQVMRSIRPGTQEPGPVLMSFADVALVGCATASDGRPFAIDQARRRIFVPVGTGGILIFDADRLTMLSTISPGALENEIGFLPPLALDERSGAIWYAALDGSIVELDGTRHHATGRRIPFAPSPHDVRTIVARNATLEILGVDGAVTTIDLDSLETLGTRRPAADAAVMGIAVGN